MSEETASQDSPHFITQRRNVMVSCLVVITIVVLNLQYNKIRVLDVTAGSPWNFDIAWAFLIWYFVWRLAQCHQPLQLMGAPRNFYFQYLLLILTELPVVKEFETRAIADHNKDLAEKGTDAILSNFNGYPQRAYTADQLQFDSIKFGGLSKLDPDNKWDVTYGLDYELTLKNKMVYRKTYPQKLSHSSTLALYARIRAYLLACWKTHYFTEYLLPYYLGLATIFYCCYHHLVS